MVLSFLVVLPDVGAKNKVIPYNSNFRCYYQLTKYKKQEFILYYESFIALYFSYSSYTITNVNSTVLLYNISFNKIKWRLEISSFLQAPLLFLCSSYFTNSCLSLTCDYYILSHSPCQYLLLINEESKVYYSLQIFIKNRNSL